MAAKVGASRKHVLRCPIACNFCTFALFTKMCLNQREKKLDNNPCPDLIKAWSLSIKRTISSRLKPHGCSNYRHLSLRRRSIYFVEIWNNHMTIHCNPRGCFGRCWSTWTQIKYLSPLFCRTFSRYLLIALKSRCTCWRFYLMCGRQA